MKREDILWIALRLMGLYLLLLVVESVASGVGSLVSLLVTAALPDFAGETGVAFEMQSSFLLAALVRTVIFVMLGLYLIRDGKKIFDWLNGLRLLPGGENGGREREAGDAG